MVSSAKNRLAATRSPWPARRCGAGLADVARVRDRWLRLALVITLACSTWTIANGARADAGNTAIDRQAAVAVHERTLTLDSHIDIPIEYATDLLDPGEPGFLQVDLPKMTAGGLDAGVFVVYAKQGPRSDRGFAAAKATALTRFAAIHRMTAILHPDTIELALEPQQLDRIHADGKLAAVIGIENGHVIGRDLGLIRTYYDLGARYMGLVHIGNNEIADSSLPNVEGGDTVGEHGGLSDYGRAVVSEMNCVGLIVDVSHASDRAAIQAAEWSRAPVVASHSGVKRLREHARNLSDDVLFAIKDNGGVVQLVALDNYVREMSGDKRAEIVKLVERRQVMKSAGIDVRKRGAVYNRELQAIYDRHGRASVDDFVDHIDYVVDLIGIEHAGISSDFDGGGGVDGWADASQTHNVTLALMRRGYTEEEIGLIWSGNFTRVWQSTLRIADSGETCRKPGPV